MSKSTGIRINKRFAIRLMGAMMACLLASCASTGGEDKPLEATGIIVEGIIIQNALMYPVMDVMIEVPATGGFAGCGNILPRTECKTSFPARDYSGNPVVVRWKEHGNPHQTDAFVVELPEDVVPGDVVWLEVIVFAAGQAGARLIQP